jgi:8-oxo-dGTP pyrophosphatase MutT (NUDIX family)
MKWFTVTRLGDHSSLTPEGFLLVRDVAIARCGQQLYYDNELGELEANDDHTIVIERDPGEVFHEDSISSFQGKPITNDHPLQAVDPDNWTQLAIGHMTNVRRGVGEHKDCLVADLLFTTRNGIAAVQSGKRALSVGYDAYYEQIAKGHGRQKDIIANHLALVDEGRCGARCTIRDGLPFYDEFIESDHPRDDEGKFAEGPGGGGAKQGGSESFSKQQPPSYGTLGGVKFEKWNAPKDDAGWEAEAKSGPDFAEPEEPDTKGKKLAAGVIVKEKDGRVWLIRPKGGYGGYKASFPKGGVDPGMSLRATAIKEAYEESGLRVKLTGYATDVPRSTSHARYYHAERIGGTPADHGWESEGVTLAPHNELHQHLNQPVDRRLARTALGDTEDKPLSLSDMTKVGQQLGSNPGGQYTDKLGKKYYVKISKSDSHAKNELLAAKLYEAAGAPIMHAMPVDVGDGKLGTATEWRKKQSNIEPNEKGDRREAQRHFATHAWLANWDAAGLEYDNQARVDGEMHTMDPGGSMIYRAQGGPKGKAWGDEVGEWHTLRDAGVNPQNAKVFGDISDQRLKRSAENVTRIPDKEIRRLVMRHGPGTETEKQDLADRLIARKKDIGQKAAKLTGDSKGGVVIHLGAWRRRLAA